MSLESSAWSTQVAGLNRSPSWLDNSRFSIVSGTDSTRSDRAGPGRVLGNAMSRGGGAITKLLAAAGERLGRGPSAAVARFLTRFLRRSLDTAQFECCFDTQHVVYEDLRGSRRPPQCSRILDYFRRLSCVQCLSHLQDALLGLPEDGGILLESEVDSNSRRLFQGLCERLIDAIRHDGAVENVLAAVYYLAAFAELLGPQCRLQLRSIHKLEACLEYRINSTSLVAADRSPLMQALIELQYRMQGATAIALSHGSVNILDSLALDSRYAVFTHRPALYIRAMELEIAIDSLYDALQLVMEKDETASDDVLETLTQLWFQSRRIPSCLPVLDLEHSAEKIGNEPSAVFSHDFAAVWKGMPVELRCYSTGHKDGRPLQKAFYRTILKWRQLDHPHVVPLLGLDAPHVDAASCTMLGIVTPSSPNGNLLDWIMSEHLSNGGICQMLREVVDALMYLHSQGIIHKNLCCSAISIDLQGRAQVGLALTSQHPWARNSLGIYHWAPLSYEEHPAIDAWLFACTCFEAFTQQQVLAGDVRRMIHYFAIILGSTPPRPLAVSPNGNLIPDRLWTLMVQCWQQPPIIPPSFARILQELVRCINEDGDPPSFE